MPAKFTLRSAIISFLFFASRADHPVALRHYRLATEGDVDLPRRRLSLGGGVHDLGSAAQAIAGDEYVRERADNFSVLNGDAGRLKKFSVSSLPGRPHQHVALEDVS